MVIAGKCLNHQFIFLIHKFFPIKFVLWISSYIKKQMLIKWLWKILNSYQCTYMKQKHFLKACINYEYWSKRSFKTLDSDFIVSLAVILHEEYLWPVWQTYLGSAVLYFFFGFFVFFSKMHLSIFFCIISNWLTYL